MIPQLPAPHFVLHDFLPLDEREQLLEWTIASEARFHHRRIVHDGAEAVRKYTLDDLGPSTSAFAERVRGGCADWIARLRVSSFALGELELRIGAYPDGTRFDFHLDAATGNTAFESTRRITAVYYYFRQPQQFTGGDIRLYHLGAGPGSDKRVAIPPAQNSLVVFPSWVGHDVTPIHCPSADFADSRFAVNCWLHQAR